MTHIVFHDHPQPVGGMGKRKEDDQHRQDLPESIRPAQSDIRDIAVDHMVGVWEECPAQEGGQVQLSTRSQVEEPI